MEKENLFFYKRGGCKGKNTLRVYMVPYKCKAHPFSIKEDLNSLGSFLALLNTCFACITSTFVSPHNLTKLTDFQRDGRKILRTNFQRKPVLNVLKLARDYFDSIILNR